MTKAEEIYHRFVQYKWNEIGEGMKKSILDAINEALRQPPVSGCLYAFLYNSCIHESSWATVSLHYSKEGTEKAMQEHKQKALDEFNEMYADDNEFDFKFGEHEDWCIDTVEVLP